MGTNNDCNYSPTQYNVQTGGASGTLNNVAPSATSGVPVISQGSASQPVFGTVAIAGGGTNATSMSTSTGIVKYDGTSLVTSSTAKIDSSDRYTNTSQPAFLATLTNTTNNVTGDGTAYTFIPDNEVFDQGGDFTLASGTFTAPVTGKYIFCVGIFFQQIGAGHTDGRVTLITSNRNYFFSRSNYAAIATGGLLAIGNSCVADLDSGDTATVQVLISGSTKTVDLLGDSGAANFFSGALFC